MKLDESFWDDRYKSFDIGWDLGVISPPLKTYFDQIKDKSLNILIPGGGNSYEAEYLYRNGFQNVYVVDISKTALNNIKARVPDYPKEQLIHSDFFDLEKQFDLIIEQTFFCALDTKLRDQYVTKMYSLLYDNGKLVGLLFDAPLFTDRPPFGGNKVEYQSRFQNHFEIITMETSYNSHISRQGKELFINLRATKQS